MKTNLSILFGLFLVISALFDVFLGDPRHLIHPVVVMGKLIQWEEGLGRRWAKTPRGLQLWGGLMVVVNIILAYGIPRMIIFFLPPIPSWLFSIYVAWTSLSAKTLADEAIKVRDGLEVSLEKGRHRLSYIVGRDTSQLSSKEILTATVETVAENTADGVIAPLLYMAVLGPSGGWAYKMINTMDSMIAYRTETYMDLGRVAALVDDMANFIPARLTAGMMVLVAKGRRRTTYRILKRDARAHLSPNSGFPEAAMAGYLGIQMGGGHYYFGTFVDKPTIGDATRVIEPEDIIRTNRMLWRVTLLGVLVTQLVFNFIYLQLW